jgi:HAMP domain-containing protein
LTDDRLYRFVQFEYAWPLGPDDGRYLLRDHAGEDAHHVLVFASWPTVPQRRSRRWGREPEPDNVPAETGLSRATLVETTVVDDEAAKAWLDSIADAAADEAVTEGLAVLNSALRAFRAVSADPVVREVTAEQALTVRVGYGAGVEVADGAWTAARDIPASSDKAGRRRSQRLSALRPQERFAAVLGGRDAVLACEELALRARLDLDQGRPREAALQTHLALEAAIAELAAFRGQEGVGRRLSELEELRDTVAAAANEALQHGPSADEVARVGDALEKVESVLRARSASAVY